LRTGRPYDLPQDHLREAVAWRRYRGAIRELSGLSDRDLSEIGIQRGDIETIARQSVMKPLA
jgi:uncharacterized protein YjiS (DUF1127 family)